MASAVGKQLNVENHRPGRYAQPIDRSHLTAQCLGDEGIEAEVLMVFEDTIAVFLERLENATSRDDLLITLHAIRGASAGIGAFAVADLAKLAETELRADQPVNPERVQDIAMAIEEARTYIGTLLRGRV